MNILIISLLITIFMTITSTYISHKTLKEENKKERPDEYHSHYNSIEKIKKISIIESIIATILILLLIKETILIKIIISLISAGIIITSNKMITDYFYAYDENVSLILTKSLLILSFAIFPEILQNLIINFEILKLFITIIASTISISILIWLFTSNSIWIHPKNNIINSIIAIFAIIILNTNIATPIALIISLAINGITYILSEFINIKTI